jgi:signal transduction histidine kinase
MGKLASAVAHEVRNPLNAISMIAQRLGREFSPSQGEEDYRGLVGTVRSESARINRIIEEFLRFARPPKLNRQPVEMDELLSETVSLIRAQAMERGIEIDEVYSNLGVWNIDREQTKQVLLNLLLNGIEAMPGGGSLSIKSYVVEGRLCVEISDTGEGILEEDLPRIFDLYFTTKDAGTGLGLSIVQRVIAEHGGWIDVDSNPGKGTTFRICLPEEVRTDE